MIQCPACKGPGGIQLFMNISPCDKCYGIKNEEVIPYHGSMIELHRSNGFVLVRLDWPAELPNRAVTWNGWLSESKLLEMLDSYICDYKDNEHWTDISTWTNWDTHPHRLVLLDKRKK